MRDFHRSVTSQALHYFARPHREIPSGPVVSAAAWRGDELAPAPDRWIHVLTPREREELDRAVAFARMTGKPLADLRADDLPLPSMAPLLAGFRERVARGVGVQVVRGVPVDRWSSEDCERFFWCFGQHLGRPGAQNRDGELLGHVRDQGVSYDDRAVRGYKTAAALSYHADAADAVGLLCRRTAKAGGRSRFVSSVTVWNELARTRPELARRLFQPFQLDTRGDGGLDHFGISPCRYSGTTLRTFYHADYFRTAERHPGAPLLDADDRAVLDAYDEIADTEGVFLEMDFEPGDVQLLSNHTVLHSRSAYVDHDDPAKKRHLLRLWLSFEDGYSVRETASRAKEGARLVGELAKGRARKELAGRFRR
jgi:hypothetical protein